MDDVATQALYRQYSTALVETDSLFPIAGSGCRDSENRNSTREEFCFSPKSSHLRSLKIGSPVTIPKFCLNGGNIPMSRRGCNAVHKLSDVESITSSVNSLPGGFKYGPTVKSDTNRDLDLDYVFLHGPALSIEKKSSKRLSSSSIQSVESLAGRGQGFDSLCDYDSTILTVAIVTIVITILACWLFAILVMGAGQ